MDRSGIWFAVGLAGQALFFSRFLAQWVASERQRKSVVPRTFWFFSLGGGLLLLLYACHRRDPVFVAGQAAGLLIYARNLGFLYRQDRERARPGAGGRDVDLQRCEPRSPAETPSRSRKRLAYFNGRPSAQGR